MNIRKKQKNYKYIFISFLLILLLIIFKEEKLIRNNYYDNFLPKINNKANNNKNINLKSIFKSRKLYINDMNITSEYIHYIRPIEDKITIIYKSTNISEIEINSILEREKQKINFSKLCVEEQFPYFLIYIKLFKLIIFKFR